MSGDQQVKIHHCEKGNHQIPWKSEGSGTKYLELKEGVGWGGRREFNVY